MRAFNILLVDFADW